MFFDVRLCANFVLFVSANGLWGAVVFVRLVSTLAGFVVGLSMFDAFLGAKFARIALLCTDFAQNLVHFCDEGALF